MTVTIHCRNEDALQRLAASLAREASLRECILLHGTLGAGKTSFARAFIRARTGKDDLEVSSPTFLIVQEYDAADKGRIYHCDFYRLKQPQDLVELGLEEWLGRDLLLVEWPDAVPFNWPADRLDVRLSIDPANPNARWVMVTPYGNVAARLEQFLNARQKWSQIHDNA